MFRINRFFIFVSLFFTFEQFEVHSLTLTDLQNNAKDLNITSSKVNDYTSYVFIHDLTCQIYFFDDQGNDTKMYHKNTMSKFYTCINCMFAHWIRHELIELVLRFLPIYHSNYLEKINNLFETCYDEVVKTLQFILVNSRYFEEILSNYLYVNEYDSYFDTQVLRSLVSLDHKIEFIINLERKSLHGSDHIIVGLLLHVVNTIQQFMYHSCELSSTDYGVEQLFGFPMYESYTKKVDINRFLTEIGGLNLKSNDFCNKDKILLLDHVFKFDLVEWHTPYGKTTVANETEKVVRCGDSEQIFWYQKNMFNTIMKLLFFKLRKEYNGVKELPSSVVEYFKDIRSNVLYGYTNLSRDLETCFTFAILNNTNDLAIAIDTYLKSVSKINLENYNDKMKNSTFDDFKLETKAMFDSFRCFIRRLEFLQNENNKYYLPNQFRPKPLQNISMSANDTTSQNYLTSQEVCNDFINLYNFCVEINVFVNSARSEDNSNNTLVLLELARRKLSKVKTVLLKIFDSFSHDTNNLNFIYNIVLPIHVFTEESFSIKDFDRLKRLIFSVMTEFNFYGLEFCTPPKYNFLFFNNTKIPHFGQIQDVEEEIDNFISKKIMTENIDKNIKNFNIFDTLFNKNSSYFVSYKNVIQINWKGEEKQIWDIYSYITSSVSSPFYLHSFYDVFYKFAMAVIFYEADHLWNYSFPKISDSQRQQILTTFHDIRKISFPKVFGIMVHGICDYAEKKLNDEELTNFVVESQRIRKQFEEFGIFIKIGMTNGNTYQKLFKSIQLVRDCIVLIDFLDN